MYLPIQTAIFHDYSHASQDFWQHRSNGKAVSRGTSESNDRLSTLLKLSDDEPLASLGAFGPGSQRSVEQYVEWSHIPLGTRKWKTFWQGGTYAQIQTEQMESTHYANNCNMSHML